MEKIKITKDMIKGQGSKLLATGLTTDKQINFYGWGNNNKPLKFVVCKGFIDDWCIYVEKMDEYQSSEEIQKCGNKIHPRTAKLLVDCDDEVLKRYRL